MQLRYVFSETATGLRRNISMSVALIVTIFVSLTLVGMGLLLNAQAEKAEKFWGDQLQITVFMCNQNSKPPNCTGRGDRRRSRTAIKDVIDEQPRGGVVLPPEQGTGVRDLEAGLHLPGQVPAGDLLARSRPPTCRSPTGSSSRTPTSTRASRRGSPTPGASRRCETCGRCSSRSTSGSTVMKWGAIAIAGLPAGRGDPPGRQHDPPRGVRAAQGDRHHAPGGRLQPLHLLPFLMETLVAALVGHRSVGAGASGVHVLRDLRQAQTELQHRRVGRLGRRARRDRPGIAVLGVLLTLDPDTRDDAQIPQSVTTVGYGQARSLPHI